MRTLVVALLLVRCCVGLAGAATPDKELQNLKGTVSYQRAGAVPHALAHSASVALVDKDFAITGDASLGVVTLADSSRVTMGSDTRVQIAFFNRAESAARFILYNGKTRFKVEHPGGRPANYTFSTPTASIAVRGTEGDIGVDGRNLVVNVYGLSDPNLPVVVTTSDGKHYTLKAGEHLVAKWIHGVIQTKVDALTQQAVAQFAELGAPVSNWAASVLNLPSSVLGPLAPNLPAISPCSGVPKPAARVIGFLQRIATGAPPTPCSSPSASPSPSPTP